MLSFQHVISVKIVIDTLYILFEAFDTLPVLRGRTQVTHDCHGGRTGLAIPAQPPLPWAFSNSE